MYSASHFASPTLRAVYRVSGPCEVLVTAEALARPSPGVMPSGSMETPHWLPLALGVGVGALPDVIGATASASRSCPPLLASPTTDGFDRVIIEHRERHGPR